MNGEQTLILLFKDVEYSIRFPKIRIYSILLAVETDDLKNVKKNSAGLVFVVSFYDNIGIVVGILLELFFI